MFKKGILSLPPSLPPTYLRVLAAVKNSVVNTVFPIWPVVELLNL